MPKRIFALWAMLIILFVSVQAEEIRPIKLTDAAGRTVKLEKTANRVVSCYYISSSAMLSLGLKGKLVGIEKKAENRSVYDLTDEKLLSLPQIGSMKEMNVEAIVALEPELILLPKKCISYVESFELLDIPVLVVDPEDEEGLRQMISLLGEACGAIEKRDALLSCFDRVMTVPKQTDGETALFLGNSSYQTVAPDGMFQSSLLRMGGYENAASSLKGNYWTEISLETLLSWNADVVFVPSDAAYTPDDLRAAFVEAGLPLPKAIEEGKVYQMPGCIEAWDSPVPSSVLGIEWLRVKHGISEMSALRDEVKTFYETFYGFIPEEGLLAEIR